MIVYADNASTTRINDYVWQYMVDMKNNYGNPSCKHRMGRNAREIIENARYTIAKKINASPEEIVFVSSGTEANCLAILGYIGLNREQHIITSSIEHISVIKSIDHLVESGYDASFLPVNRDGKIDINQLLDEICSDTGLISIIFANNEIGTVQDIAKIGEIARKFGIVFHTDAVAAFPHIEIDVEAMNIDMMSLSGHKFHSIKGIGVLYINRDLDIEPLILGGSQEWDLRAGTENILGIISISKAAEILDYSAHYSTMNLIEKLKHDILRDIPKARINNFAAGIPIVNVRFDDVDGKLLVQQLSAKGVYVSQRSCSDTSGHVLSAIGLTPKQVSESIRISLGRDNTMQEVEYMHSVLTELVNNPQQV